MLELNRNLWLFTAGKDKIEIFIKRIICSRNRTLTRVLAQYLVPIIILAGQNSGAQWTHPWLS